MSTGVLGSGRAKVPERSMRQDRWWLSPAVTFVVFSTFVVYATWRAFSGGNFYASPYLSPFYSPCLSSQCPEAASDFGQPFGGFPLSPALLVLIFPLGFRLSCYYYRKAYFRAFWLSPPACAVAEPHKKYTGETRFPLIFNNVHRWFMYASVVVALILSYDTVLSFRNAAHEWGHAGLGSLIMLVNIVLIWGYTLGCHSCRHIIGGRLRSFSKHPVRYRLWGLVGKLNGRHAFWAWASLISVGLTDFYVYLLATGTITDVRFF
jgi:hypothetical protein